MTTPHTPFVDPYQPRDRQPGYPPPITRREITESLIPDRGPTGTNAPTGPAPHGSVLAGVALIGGAMITAVGGGLFACLAAAWWAARTRSVFIRQWSVNAHNFLLGYCIAALVVWVATAVTKASWGIGVGWLLSTVAALALLVSGVRALGGTYRPLPVLVRRLRD